MREITDETSEIYSVLANREVQFKISCEGIQSCVRFGIDLVEPEATPVFKSGRVKMGDLLPALASTDKSRYREASSPTSHGINRPWTRSYWNRSTSRWW